MNLCRDLSRVSDAAHLTGDPVWESWGPGLSDQVVCQPDQFEHIYLTKICKLTVGISGVNLTVWGWTYVRV